jgi:hypothetical protein
MAQPAIYSIDTSALVHGWRRAYPPKRFSALWAKIDELIEQGRLVASIEVLHELEKKDDDVFAWAKERKATLFREIDEDVQGAVVFLMQTYPKLVDTGKGKSGGDPFVIAQAMAANPRHVVVTQEAGGSNERPKIPFVCQAEGVECIDLLSLIEAEDWSF